MCELSSRARAFSVEALIGVKRQRTEETGEENVYFCLPNISSSPKITLLHTLPHISVH
jgi:hypothetical protein